MSVRVVLDQAGLNKVLSSRDGPVGHDLIRRCQRVTNEAKRLCPVDTGNLRASITFEIQQQGSDLIGRVGTNVPYARYVHDGTKYMRARPFLRDALPAATQP
jgi:HK97 gp10 family phage protein